MDTDPDIARFEQALSSLVLRFGNRRFAREIADSTGHKLPAASWVLLDHLHTLGPMRVSDIAALHGVEMCTVTPRLHALEQAGLIQRNRDPADGRVSVIAIGEAGRLAMTRVHSARTKLMAQALTSDDLGQLRTLAPLIERMSDHLHDLATLRGTADKEESHR